MHPPCCCTRGMRCMPHSIHHKVRQRASLSYTPPRLKRKPESSASEHSQEIRCIPRATGTLHPTTTHSSCTSLPSARDRSAKVMMAHHPHSREYTPFRLTRRHVDQLSSPPSSSSSSTQTPTGPRNTHRSTCAERPDP